jgi:hypothetical protein
VIESIFFKEKKTNIERGIFAIALLLALLPIWTAGTYFVTGDGPCHTYNAAVLLDWLKGKNTDFYGQFYTLNPHFDPNWWTHVCLVLLQMVFSPAFAEKLFLTLYVVAFGFGLRFLIQKINPKNVFLSSIGLLFCWHHLLQMGFFNYSWSIVGMFWLVGFWLHCRPKMSTRQGVLMAFGWLLLYSMHPIGLTFTGLAIGLALLAEATTYARMSSVRLMFGYMWRRVLICFCTALPTLYFALDYLHRKNWNHSGNDETTQSLARDIGTISVLTTMNRSEHGISNVLIVLLALLFIYTIYKRFNAKKWVISDFWLVFMVLALCQYFSQSGKNALELLMPLRLQMLPWLGLFFWIATGYFNQKIQLFASFSALILASCFLWQRLPAHQAASRLVEEWISVASNIRERSVVMVVNYNFNGSDEQGKIIGDGIWMFNHAADYLGAQKSGTIMSDNYEALLRYFPLIWRIEGDMYNRTAVDGIGFEDRPPMVDLLGFPKRSQGRKIDYVLVLDQKDADRAHERGKDLMRQLGVAYRKIGVSSSGRAELYEKI